ncbi:uncharacterized protein PV07_08670 [Cladophialophora immunda]|uniref:Uncharacterized protein n=1 Tax=Cladophialophora immunda TaxID=569365 RepID=A0A0D2CPP7_9EURO|nr:uncharacterized protein PV07_08670 [Cladophialophora immunda]KIW25504.1 hypothetical protein PV07_08670 [Cladophialophora immunda]
MGLEADNDGLETDNGILRGDNERLRAENAHLQLVFDALRTATRNIHAGNADRQQRLDNTEKENHRLRADNLGIPRLRQAHDTLGRRLKTFTDVFEVVDDPHAFAPAADHPPLAVRPRQAFTVLLQHEELQFRFSGPDGDHADQARLLFRPPGPGPRPRLSKPKTFVSLPTAPWTPVVLGLDFAEQKVHIAQVQYLCLRSGPLVTAEELAAVRRGDCKEFNPVDPPILGGNKVHNAVEDPIILSDSSDDEMGDVEQTGPGPSGVGVEEEGEQEEDESEVSEEE